uniref:Ribonuclease H-like domain-containing protein n=1 Tax=Tanacetum cinerariifolium TaxID=118510 RepID=A0A6L2MUI1_TANCI|nr:ribonuclease H-like domain-containing protein [Tanacetum cinerariifolium]
MDVSDLHLQLRYGEKSDGLVTCRDAEIPGSVVVRPNQTLDHAWMVYSSWNKNQAGADASETCEALLTMLVELGKAETLGVKSFVIANLALQGGSGEGYGSLPTDFGVVKGRSMGERVYVIWAGKECTMYSVLNVHGDRGEIAIIELRKKLEIAQKEKDDIHLNVDKFEYASTSLNKLIECQIVDNCHKGLGYKNYNAVPPPYTGNFMPQTPDLSFTGLDEFVNKPVFENCKAKSSEDEPKVVRKNDNAPIIEEWVSDNEEDDVSQPKIEKKIVRPNIAKIEFFKSKQQEETSRKTVKQVEQHKQNTHNYEEIDRGYITFRGNPKGGKITGKVTKDETSDILKSFITGIENLVDHKVKIIRCNNETEFKNREMNQFCEIKSILRQFSVARTPQQNRVAERRNRILIEAARTMLADSKLPTTFWAEAVNTACYVQKRVLVVKPHNKTPYELFHDRTPTLSFMRPFGCPVTILNTIDHLGKFDGKDNEGFFVRYSLNNKAFRVFNGRTRIVEENLHIRFSESTPNVVGSGPNWLFDIDALTKTMNYEPIVADLKSSHDDGSKPSCDDGKKFDEDPRKESKCKDQKKKYNVNNTNNVNTAGNVNTVSSTVNVAGINEDNELPFDPNMHALEDVSIFNFSIDDEDDGTVADMNNLDTTI